MCVWYILKRLPVSEKVVDIYLHINYCQLLILRRLKISFNFLSYEMTNYLKSVNRNWSETISFQGVKTTYDFNIWTDLWLEITSIMIREKLPIIFSCFLISFVTGESCWNSFENILETRQIPGRLDKDQRWLTKQFVVSKMECLDICLRTTRCAFFLSETKD